MLRSVDGIDSSFVRRRLLGRLPGLCSDRDQGLQPHKGLARTGRPRHHRCDGAQIFVQVVLGGPSTNPWVLSRDTAASSEQKVINRVVRPLHGQVRERLTGLP